MDLDTERWLRIDRVLAETFERPPEERRSFAAQQLADDPSLADEIFELLDADAQAGAFLHLTPGPLVADLLASAWIGRRVGPYRLCEVIGFGGMGTVFRAERDDGEFRHQVAVKLLRGDRLDADQRLRFSAERQILARLEHPNIARLYDGGTCDDGTSYLVMELVEGLSLDRYCEQHRLSIEARLGLFGQVCDAVSYAHRRQLIHRDLKPSNILVTPAGIPKLLDFGIAKQLGLSALSSVTTTRGARPMSLSYASPEQVLNEPTTTATDVYSLGVLLYELVTGRWPYRLERGGRGLARAICEQEPEPPSQAVLRLAGEHRETAQAAAAARGLAHPRALARRLRGDLDAIVLRALHKRPEDRFCSIESLSEDLDRHRALQPVRARRGGAGYRIKKLFERHRWVSSAVTLAFAVALLAIGNYVWQTRRVTRERDKAETALSILTDAFTQADFTRGAGTVTARQVLDRGADRIERDLAAEPLVKAALLHALGEAYSGIGEWDRAQPRLEEALEIRRGSLGESHPDTASTRLALGVVLRERTLWKPAEEMLSRATSDLEAAYGDQHIEYARALRELGRLHFKRGRLDLAEKLYEQASAIFERELPPSHPEIIRALDYRAELLFRRDDLEGARRLNTRAIEALRQTYGEDTPEVANSMGNLATLAMSEGRWAEGEALARKALEILRRTVDEDHPWIEIGLHNVGLAAAAQGHLQDAAEAYREAVTLARHRYGDRHPEVLSSLGNLGVVLKNLGDLDAASTVLEEAVDLSKEVLGARHRRTGLLLCHLGDLRRLQGEWGLAKDLLESCQEIIHGAVGDRGPNPSLPLAQLGLLAMDTGHPEEAEPLLRQSFEIRRRTLGEDHWRTAETAGELGVCLAKLGRDSEAETLLRATVDLFADRLEPTDYRRVRAESDLATLYARRGRTPPQRRTEPQPADSGSAGDLP